MRQDMDLEERIRYLFDVEELEKIDLAIGSDQSLIEFVRAAVLEKTTGGVRFVVSRS